MKILKIYMRINGSKNPFIRFIVCSFLLSALSFSSCKKFVEVPAPNTEVTTSTVFNNNGTATSAQVSIYAQMWSNSESYYIADNMGEYADELQSYSSGGSTNYQQYTDELIAAGSNGYTYANWSNYYNYIYQANSVISGLQTISGTSAAVKQQLSGEAYFTRAFWHFYLTNIWGAVPLVLTTNYNTNGTIARTPRVQVLQQVVADLKTAESLLRSNYVDGTDTAATTARVRPNKSAAQALLARAYLYLADYDQANSKADFQKAEVESDTVISNSAYKLAPLSGVFLANSSETIWQLATPSNQGYDAPDGVDFILLGAPNTGGPNSDAISTQLLNSFETGDQRMNSWIGSLTEGTQTYYFPYKYKNYTYVGTEQETVLRLGEQYLIRAEAEAELGQTGPAENDLNAIRNRAGLPNTTATTQIALLAAILHERQVELFTEWGHRWFDLCRTNNANSVMEVVVPQKGGTWNADGYQQLFPIPETEIQADSKLTQNAGY